MTASAALAAVAALAAPGSRSPAGGGAAPRSDSSASSSAQALARTGGQEGGEAGFEQGIDPRRDVGRHQHRRCARCAGSARAQAGEQLAAVAVGQVCVDEGEVDRAPRSRRSA